jgi:ketosteroid isomerase-like protein
MSQENVEVVRRAWEAYREGGFAAGRDFLHRDFEMVRSGTAYPESGTYRGYEAAMNSMQDYRGAFEDHRTEPEEFIDAGDHVVVAQSERGRARSSSVELQETWYAVCTLREGKILRLQWFGDRSEALGAVGLAE